MEKHPNNFIVSSSTFRSTLRSLSFVNCLDDKDRSADRNVGILTIILFG